MNRPYLRKSGSDYRPLHKAKSNQRKYEQNWNRIFGKKEELSQCPSCYQITLKQFGKESICMECGVSIPTQDQDK